MNSLEDVVRERHIRVFVSSTFDDMRAERDVLVKKIFPQLRRLCEERAVTWTEVDLRWGITDEQAAEGKVLPLCLAEIERCRPFFIGMLGDRYGWVPPPDSISDELIKAHPWLAEHFEQSVTELEIQYGVLRNLTPAQRAFLYFRDPQYARNVAAADRAKFTSDDRDRSRLEDLKRRVRAAGKSGRLALREGYTDPETLGAQVLADFGLVIEQLFPAGRMPDPLDRAAARHDAYARGQRFGFVGRRDLIERLDAKAAASDAPLVLVGDPGCGKTALLSAWGRCWRRNHSDGLFIQHFIGSSPDSADWKTLVSRVLNELKRAYNFPEDIPVESSGLRSALSEWTTRVGGGRSVMLVLDALDQLANEEAARQLGWLPVTFPRNFHLVVSCLPGESLEVIRRRGWSELAVPLFTSAEIVSAALTYFGIFGKSLPSGMLAKLQSTPAARNPLYLRAVLDELRQFGDREALGEKADHYFMAPDLPTLFDRILTRWDDDFGKHPEHPDLVRRTMSMIACARFGLSEAELTDLLGGDGEPLPHRSWAPFYLAFERFVTVQGGLINFAHDFLATAVRDRWLRDANFSRDLRLRLAEYFEQLAQPTERKLDELPMLLRVLNEWDRLKNLLADLPTFLRLRDTERWKCERLEHWLPLRSRYDIGEVLSGALSEWERCSAPNARELAFMLSAVAIFHMDSGDYENAERMFRRALTMCEQELGSDHPEALENLHNLACLLQHKGDAGEAQVLYERALAISCRSLGSAHPETLVTMSNLAMAYAQAGDIPRAEQLYRGAFEICTTALGPIHHHTAVAELALAGVLAGKGDASNAKHLMKHAVSTFEQLLGREHLETVSSVLGLAGLLADTGESAEAELLYRRCLAASERTLGRENRITLSSMDGLALLLARRKGDLTTAEPLLRSVLEIRQRVLGSDHPDTFHSMNNLAMLLESRRDLASAEALHRQTLQGRRRYLGEEHPNTLESINNLAGVLETQREYDEAEALYRAAAKTNERVFGATHPRTLLAFNNLAWLLESKKNYSEGRTVLRRALCGALELSASAGQLHPHLDTFARNYYRLLTKMGERPVDVEAEMRQMARRFGIDLGGQAH